MSAIAAIVLAAASSGCCLGAEDDLRVSDFDGSFTGMELEDVRAAATTAEERCAIACFSLAAEYWDAPTEEDGEVSGCVATVAGQDVLDPWSPEHDSVEVSCEITETIPSMCSVGRRPAGHRDAEITIESFETWMAAHAHLEAASVHAFEELAEWLCKRAAPAELIERCRCAAADEIVHARLLSTIARRCGAIVPAPDTVETPEDLLSIAVRNAVEGCVHESFAAITAAYQAEHAASPELREIFHRIAADELRHGQLAWDLHAFIWNLLSSDDRTRVSEAQRGALADLSRIAATNAAAAPEGLGTPPPAKAARMARHFAALVAA